MNAADLMTRRREKRMFAGYDERGLSLKPDPDDDIKDYAETTMNELLGWYGYEKVSSRDTQGLNLTHFASTTDAVTSSPPSTVREGSDESGGGARRGTSNGNRTPTTSRPNSASPDASPLASDEVVRQHQQMVSALTSVTKHPDAPDSPNLPPGCIVCAWCQKVGMKLFTLKTPNGCKAFCSELCFTQCRRASFKKNKICDWCKHVRHTVNYVDFQDGEQQLQFCSDKCLNQYKMNIFCKETQAHLQMHTHLKEAACKMAASGSMNLITPDLWLRDCKAQANGVINSPKDTGDADDNMSDDNISIMPSPPRIVEKETLPPPTVTRDKTKHKSDYNRPAKVRDKLSRRSHKMSSKYSSSERSDPETRSFHFRLKEKKMNGNSPSRRSELEDLRTNSHMQLPLPTNSVNPLVNGPHLMPSSTIGSTPRPPALHHPLPPPPPPRLCPPRLDNMRPPFMNPNMIPNPFHIFAQQQMESFMRAQNRINPHPSEQRYPLPPWPLPPFLHSPPQPPTSLPTPSVPAPRTPRSNRSEIHGQQKSHKSSKHKQHSSTNHQVPHPPPPLPHPPVVSSTSTPPSKPPGPPPSSLLPPVTVMVPFPVVLPLPLPIPIPIPVPKYIFDNFRNKGEMTPKRTEANKVPHADLDLEDEDDNMPLKLVKHGNSKAVDSQFHLPNGRNLSWAQSFKRRSGSPECPSEEVPRVSSASPFNQCETDARLEDSCSYSSLSENISMEDEEISEDIQIEGDHEESLSFVSQRDFIKSSQDIQFRRERTPSPAISNGKRTFSSTFQDQKDNKRPDTRNDL